MLRVLLDSEPEKPVKFRLFMFWDTVTAAVPAVMFTFGASASDSVATEIVRDDALLSVALMVARSTIVRLVVVAIVQAVPEVAVT
jgi:hypothetical protein